MSAELEFVNPPPANRGGRGHGPTLIAPETVAALKARPGEWARLPDLMTDGQAAAVTQWCSRHRGYEATRRRLLRNEDGFDVYVRYVGEVMP